MVGYAYCTCKKENKHSAEGFHITAVDKEGICLSCGYYAFRSIVHIRECHVDNVINQRIKYFKEDKEYGPSSLQAIRSKKRRQKNEQYCKSK